MKNAAIPTRAPGKETARDWRPWIICLALAAMVFGVFGQTVSYEFIDYDDPGYVYENPMVVRGLTGPGVAWAFTSFYGDNWHPVTWLSHMLDCQIYGLHPGGHHLTSVLLHAVTAVLLFLVVRQLSGALWRSAFVAAVFAIHPLRVESVAWVSERKDVLSALFFVLTIAAYVRYARGPRTWPRYGLVMLLFVLGLMCKPMLVSLPLILLLLDFWPLRRGESWLKLAVEKIPLLALSLVSGVVTLVAQHGAIQSGGSFAFPLRLGNALASTFTYLQEIVWPVGLVLYYPVAPHGIPAQQVILSGVVVAAISALAVWLRRKQPWLLMGWLWYLVMLMPVLGLVQVGGQAHADRYTYLPQIGIYLAVTWCLAESQASRAVLGGLAAGALGMFFFCAWQQTSIWQNSETVWSYTLANTTDNDVACENMGVLRMRQGKLEEAMAFFQKTLEIQPDSPDANNNLGNALLKVGQIDEAIAHCQRAVQLMPGDAEAWANLANGLFRKGRVDDAIADFHKALQLNPGMAMGYNNLGAALRAKGRLDDAIVEYKKALQLKPRLAEANYNLAIVLLQKNQPEHALSHLQEAVESDPTDPTFSNSLAWMLATSSQASLRNGTNAVVLARRASDLAGGNDPAILGTLAAALAEAGNFDEAARTARDALARAQAAGQKDLAHRLADELELYMTKRPYHQP